MMPKKLTMVFRVNGPSYDHDDILWFDDQGNFFGLGYIGRGDDKTIRVVRCPECVNENYMSQPICIKCGFFPNPKEKESAQ
jgi:hypothetical protein